MARALELRPGRIGPAGRRTDTAMAYALAGGALAVVALFTIYPVGYALVGSLYTLSPILPRSFAGLSNYGLIFGSPYFGFALRTTAVLALATVPAVVLLGLLVAVLLSRPFRGATLVKVVILLPWTIPAATGGVMWKGVFADAWGALNATLYELGLVHNYVAWLTTPRLAFLATTIAQVWAQFPLAAVLLLAAMQAIPDELYEAAALDGAGGLRAFAAVTLPHIQPMLVVVTLFALAPFLWVILSGFLPEVAILTVPPEWLKYGVILDNYRYIVTGEVPRAYQVGGVLRRMISEEVRAVPRAALNSTLVALGTLLLNWILGAPAAYAYARMRFAGRVGTFYFNTASRLIAAAALAIPYYLIIKQLGLLDRHLALILIHTALTLPFTVLILVLYFRTIPKEIEESAQLDGATRPMILRRIVIPLALPSLVGTGLFAFMLSYSEFLFSMLVLGSPETRTLPVTLASVSTNPDVTWTLLSAGTTLAVLPALLLVWPIWRYMVRGLVTGAV